MTATLIEATVENLRITSDTEDKTKHSEPDNDNADWKVTIHLLNNGCENIFDTATFGGNKIDEPCNLSELGKTIIESGFEPSNVEQKTNSHNFIFSGSNLTAPSVNKYAFLEKLKSKVNNKAFNIIWKMDTKEKVLHIFALQKIPCNLAGLKFLIVTKDRNVTLKEAEV